MAIPASLSESFDQLYTSTWQDMRTTAVDNIFDATPFYWYMRKKGGIKRIEGGRWIGVPLMYGKNTQKSWLTKGGTIALNEDELLTTARYVWRYLAFGLVRFWVDELQNRGKHQIINMVSTKLENGKLSMIDELETSLFTAQTGNEMNGLPDVCHITADNTFGGIARGTYTWWANQIKTATGSFAVYGISDMRNLFNTCSANSSQDTPDILLTGQAPFEWYEDETLEFKQIVNKDLADASFDFLQFKGKPLIWSPSGPATSIFYLNMKYLEFVIDQAADFDMTDWKPIPNQTKDRAAQILIACQLLASRSKCLGVLHTMTA